MSEAPLVSVVTIFLDAERFIEEAIESVFAQTYDRWELLLVDDGSTDASRDLARRYAARYPARVRYLDHPGHENRGMSPSRNLGIAHAAGPLVAFLDADDVWLPEKLAHQVAALDRHPSAGMACGATLYWHGWAGGPEAEAADVVLPIGAPPEGVVAPPELLRLLYPLGTGTAPCPSDLLVRRSVLERVGGFEERFRGENQMYEDQAFLAKVYLTTPVFVSSACLLRYRIHPQSCVAGVTRAGRYAAVRRFFLEWFESYLVGGGLRGSPGYDLVQAALWPYRNPVLARAVAMPRGAAKDLGRRVRKLYRSTLRRAAW